MFCCWRSCSRYLLDYAALTCLLGDPLVQGLDIAIASELSRRGKRNKRAEEMFCVYMYSSSTSEQNQGGQPFANPKLVGVSNCCEEPRPLKHRWQLVAVASSTPVMAWVSDSKTFFSLKHSPSLSLNNLASNVSSFVSTARLSARCQWIRVIAGQV